MNLYAGIGSRETPPDILALMKAYAAHMAAKTDPLWHLVSGGATGADTAFASGANSVDPDSYTIWRPNDTRPEHLDHAATYHPAWDRCTPYARQLHARNSIIVLGLNLRTPVHHIICWTPNGAVTGGTGQALRIAADWNIPVYNLGRPPVLQSLLVKLANNSPLAPEV